MWAFYVLGGLFIIFIIITIRIIKELNDHIEYLLEENEKIRKAAQRLFEQLKKRNIKED